MVQFIKDISAARLWGAGILLSGVVAFSLVELMIPAPVGWAACFGWGLVALNSMFVRAIHDRAAGGRRAAFLGWGLVANGIRMLTLVMIFAYMAAFFRSERGSFLLAGFSAFFVLMPVEVWQLIRFQDKAVDKFEHRCDAN